MQDGGASGRQPSPDASDLVQETLMRIGQGLDLDDPARFRGQDVPQFLGWVAMIVRNVGADHHRHGRAALRDRRRNRPGSALLALLSAGSTPEQRAERRENALQVAAALDRLPSHQREILRWRFFEQLSFEEIGERTGKSVGALRVACLRALERLRRDEQLRREMGASS